MTERLRMAMIGTGWWATTAHLPSMAANARIDLVAVCDPDPSRAAAAALAFDVPQEYSDIEELLARAEVDAVVIATPHTTHFELASAALRAGVHVLVEKPLTTTAADAWELVRLAAERDLVLSVGATYQYADTALRVGKAVREQIGEIVSINAEFSSTTLWLFQTTELSEEVHADPSVPHGTTYSNPALSGGGQGQTQLTHVLGSVIAATGQQATEVFAMMDHRGLAVDVVDGLVFRLEGGAVCTASSTGTAPEDVPVRHRVRYHGTLGMVEHDLLLAEAWVFHSNGLAEHITHSVHEPSYSVGAPVARFAEQILDGGPDHAPAQLAAAAVSLIDAAYTSADSGTAQPVTRADTRGTVVRHE
jgi:predicted dehydrogenase